MDESELEQRRLIRERRLSRERQEAGLDRHFKLDLGVGWFIDDPQQLLSELQHSIAIIKKVYDTSGSQTTVGDKKYQLPQGSFNLELEPAPHLGVNFSFSHPDDIQEFLQQSGVTKPEELTGR